MKPPVPEEQRAAMVARQLRARGIRDERVLAAMGSIPRTAFVDEHLWPIAYDDAPLEIGYGQTISQPYMTAFMVQALDPGPEDKVLEVGAGSGYHAAVLASMAAQVVALELIPELAALARANLARIGLDDRVLVVVGDGSEGYVAEAPYDRISVAAAAPEVPEPLIEQLADGGRMVIPVGSEDEQDLLLLEKRSGQVSRRRTMGCRFVPLLGRRGWQR